MPLVRDLTKFTTASPILATYNFTDLVTGLGYIRYLGFTSADSSGTNYSLTTNSGLSSRDIETTIGAGTTKLKFDSSPFIQGQTATGTAFVTAAIGSTNNTTCTITWEVCLMRDGVSTRIGNIVSDTWASAGAEEETLTSEIDLTTTQFQEGDVLRLSGAFVVPGGTWRLGTDPSNRAGLQLGVASAPSRLDLWIPWEINQ